MTWTSILTCLKAGCLTFPYVLSGIKSAVTALFTSSRSALCARSVEHALPYLISLILNWKFSLWFRARICSTSPWNAKPPRFSVSSLGIWVLCLLVIAGSQKDPRRHPKMAGQRHRHPTILGYALLGHRCINLSPLLLERPSMTTHTRRTRNSHRLWKKMRVGTLTQRRRKCLRSHSIIIVTLFPSGCSIVPGTGPCRILMLPLATYPDT